MLDWKKMMAEISEPAAKVADLAPKSPKKRAVHEYRVYRVEARDDGEALVLAATESAHDGGVAIRTVMEREKPAAATTYRAYPVRGGKERRTPGKQVKEYWDFE